MVEKNSEKVYLVRMYRENGKMEEFFTTAPDDSVALDNMQKSFNREFKFLDVESEISILEEANDE